MKNYRGLASWFIRLDPRITTCGQLHPDLHLPCEKTLGHSTLGRSGLERAHEATPPSNNVARRCVWTLLADHRWRIDQRRRGRHPAGGSEAA